MNRQSSILNRHWTQPGAAAVYWGAMNLRLVHAFLLVLILAPAVQAQRPANAPDTAPSGKPPDTVFIEDLTWAEVRDLVKAG